MSVLHQLISWAPIGLPAFMFVLCVVVFVHELGHFLVARAFGVGIETFSICFGKEIFGWTDRKGTRWKIGWLPLGGYVKFLGDADAASTPDRERIAGMNEAEKASTLQAKPLYQRALVVVAGPAANFVLALVIFTLVFGLAGARVPATVIGAITPHTPAAEAGFRPGDKITAIDGHPVRMFDEMRALIQKAQGRRPVRIAFERQGQPHSVTVTPRVYSATDIYGTPVKTTGIGVGPSDDSRQNTVYVRIPLLKAPIAGAMQCAGIVEMQLTALWRIVSRRSDPKQLGSFVGIAGVSQKAASSGFYDLTWLIAFLSVSIGLINLFPIPLLDGGHLLYYGCEAVLGRPLKEGVQEAGFKLGLALVLGLMIFATWNDLVR